MPYYAHSRGPDSSQWQELIDHLANTAELAAGFGRDAGVEELARLAGLLHDLGKYSPEFQARLRGSSVKVDHATAGAKELVRLFKGTPQEPLAMLLAYCISGHHSGLLDWGDITDLPGDGTLQARLKTDVCDYSAYASEVSIEAADFPRLLNLKPLRLKLKQENPAKDLMGFSFAMLVRMVYSALVDADFQETETFARSPQGRGVFETIPRLRETFNTYLHRYDTPATAIDRKRKETLDACLANATKPAGFFKLTVPTGGGKTLSSMAFALNHAAIHGLKHIIYVIPFTTIIEQNAGVFKEILGEDSILEHHSNFDWEHLQEEVSAAADDRTRSIYAKLKLASENWDVPVVVTTNVQFFESLFARKSSRCRKLHNLAKSVIIFDEAQMFPRDLMLPAVSAVWELVTNYGATAVFCTATQPNLERFLPEGTPVTELAPDPQDLFRFYKRVTIRRVPEKLADQDLAERLTAHDQVMCITNTRKHASGLFRMLNGDGNHHLSTLMCPAHRKQVLAEIRRRLNNGETCRVVSTSVMEAGIDVDFPCGYRALTGLDSINQAAGRVNRGMLRPDGDLYIFEPDSEFVKKTPRYVAQGIEVTRGVLRDYEDQPISVEAVSEYFQRLYALKDWTAFDYQNILGDFSINRKSTPVFNFKSAAEKFRVIEDVTRTLIIPFNDEADGLIEDLRHTDYPASILRKLQPYTVSIYEYELKSMRASGAITAIADVYDTLNSLESHYDQQTGLIIPSSTGGEGLFI